MDLGELAPGLYYLRFPVGHAYLCADTDGLTLIDTSLPGSADEISNAIRQAGLDPADLRQIVLTHCHPDHSGSAAPLAATFGSEIAAGAADVPFLRGAAAPPPPQLVADWERSLYEQVTSGMPAVSFQPVAVSRELHDGDELDFGGGAVTVAVPGHTPGSVAFYLPAHRALIAGDALARRPDDGQVMLGVFNSDPAEATASLHRLAEFEPQLICFGHAEPLSDEATDSLHAAAQQ
jgi:glyoxylase-like metal-dependent hydrolase (beta-lactamase superfamily II)